jgi:ATP synthase alpha/beta family, nucleotide-binding domain
LWSSPSTSTEKTPVIAPPPSSPDLPTVLIDHAVGRDRRRGAAPVESDRRAANVENRVALERLQRPGIGEPHTSVAGIDDARRSVDREEAVALHGDVEWIARRDQGARTARDEPGSGIRVIDLFTPLCAGQRIGVFAGSGVGKSSLLGMLARAPDFDVVVIALVGERGREVREFLDDTLGENRRSAIASCPPATKAR